MMGKTFLGKLAQLKKLSICHFCGKSVAFFKGEHPECQSKYNRLLKEMISQIQESIISGKNYSSLEASLKDTAVGLPYLEENIQDTLIRGWGETLEFYLEDHFLSPGEEIKLLRFQQFFQFSEEKLNRYGGWKKVEKAVVLRNMIKGGLPGPIDIQGYLPFHLQKKERLYWFFDPIEYFHGKLKNGNEASLEFSPPPETKVVAKNGILYTANAFKDFWRDPKDMLLQDSGKMGVTNLGLYFYGHNTSIKIPFNKVLTFSPFQNGLGLTREGASRPDFFQCEDGWFAFNFITNLARLEAR